ncbi:hypothetical protein U1Q18_027919, partial [Sarracenia purpurea var. burkii]
MDCASPAPCLRSVNPGLGFLTNRRWAGAEGYIAICTCRGSPRVGNRGMRCGNFARPPIPESLPLSESQR